MTIYKALVCDPVVQAGQIPVLSWGITDQEAEGFDQDNPLGSDVTLESQS